MGQTQSIEYSVPVAEKKDGETEIRRCKPTVDGLVYNPKEGTQNLQQIWEKAVADFGDWNFLWQRDANGKYQPKTYKETNEISRQLGSGIRNLNLVPVTQEYQNYKLEMVGIYAKNRQEWMFIDVGCGMLQGMTTVPLYDTLGAESVSYCLNHSNMEVIFCDAKSIESLLKTNDIGRIKTMIALDAVTQEQRQTASSRNIQILTFQEVLDAGKQNLLPNKQYGEDRIHTFSYTSGTTGNPKAAMLSDKNFTSGAAIFDFNYSLKHFVDSSRADGIPLVHLSYLPLPHVFERIVQMCLLRLGCEIYYYSGDVAKLKDDIKEVRPTIFVSVPRLFNKFFDKIQEGFAKKPFHLKTLIKIAVAAKLSNIQKSAIYTHALWDKLIFSKIREDIFGGRVRIMVSGSAPISKDVLEFMELCLSCPLLEGYGSTESTGASFCKWHNDPVSGHIGGPMSNMEYKLEDIPEMQYLSTDEQPRGEICMRGPGVFAGYYKDEEKTAEAIDKDGWLHTGDVGQLDRASSRLRIIDRKKNIFKLAQGEYVAPEKIENSLVKVPGVAEIFVYGDSLQSTLVSVLVPEEPFVVELSKTLGVTGTFEELCNNETIKKNILQALNTQARADKLHGFEIPKAIHIFPQSLQTVDCMTTTFKLQRHKAKKVFEKEIQAMYDQILAAQQ